MVDFYELLIEGDRLPSVVVDFDDGERLYLTAREPNVLPIDPDDDQEEDDWDDDEEEDGDEDDVEELDAHDAFRRPPDEDDDEEE